MKFLHPDLTVDRLWDIPVDWLESNGIRLVFCDLDNTIVPYHTTVMEPDARAWLQKVKEHRIDVVVVSNNVPKRIQACLADPEFPQTLAFSCKPFAFGVRKCAKERNIPLKDCAFVGDQVFTDLLAARFHGSHAILSNPLDKDARATTGILRRLEDRIIQRAPRKGDHHHA